MSNKKYDPKLVQYVFYVNARFGIPEEQTALAIAQDFGKEQELQEALKDRKKGWIFRRHAEDITSILARVCVMPREYSSTVIEGKYVLMPRTPTYAQGVHALREACKAEVHSPHPQFVLDDGSRIYRPLTFKEIIEARVTDYENNKNTEERKRLFQRCNDSCTGVAYKANTTKLKIVPVCPQLITLDTDFNGAGLAIEYDDLEGTELDRATGKYDAYLTKSKVLAHEGWRTAVENDLELLKTYRDIVFTELGRNDAMAFYVLDKSSKDHLRALFVGYLINDSVAYGNSNLNYNGSFLRVALSSSR